MSGRIRTVKPEWLEDERLAAASDEARLLTIALILMADDYGRGRAAIATIAAGAWRYEMERNDGAGATETLAKASRALRETVAIGFVDLYEVGGQRYFAIRNWSRHQRVDKAGKPRVPPPNAAESHDSGISRETLATPSRDTPEILAPDLRSPISDLRSPTTERESRAPARAEPPRHIARMEQSYSTELAEHREIARWFSEHRAEGGAGRWTWDGKAWGSGYEHLDRIRIALADEPDREGTFAAAMRGFLADERAKQHGYPIAWLATDLGGYAARGADDSAERRNLVLEAAETEAREAREAYQLRFGKDGPEEDSKRLKRLQAAREGLRKARKAS